jgi:hypothetical protein
VGEEPSAPAAGAADPWDVAAAPLPPTQLTADLSAGPFDLGAPEEPVAPAEPILEVGDEVLEVTAEEPPPEPAPIPAAEPAPEPAFALAPEPEPPPAPAPVAPVAAPPAVPPGAAAPSAVLAPPPPEVAPPAPPAPAAKAAPAPVEPPPGAPPSAFIAGAHRVVVHTADGQVKRGTLRDAALDGPALQLLPQVGSAPETLPAERVKAIFFMLATGETPPQPAGKKVRVTFRDGRQVAGFSPDYAPERVGFFMVPVDTRTHTARIWVYRASVRQVTVS